MQNLFQPNLYKCFTFYKVKKPLQKNMQEISKIIKSSILDYQYINNFERQQINMIDGQRALKLNGVKVIKQNQSYYIQVYSKEIQTNKNQLNTSQNEKIPFNKISSISDPKSMIEILGYKAKQVFFYVKKNKYTVFNNLQVYKSSAYGIQVIIYPKKQEIQYIELCSVSFLQQGNLVHNFLILQLNQYVEEDKSIDPFTLKPKNLNLFCRIV